MKRVKICGIRTMEEIGYVNEYLPDYIGFVFVSSSKRYIQPEIAAELKKKLSAKIQVCGVFVNEQPETILSLVENGTIDLVQLHGDETQKDIHFLKKRIHVPIIKAIRVKDRRSIQEADCLSCDYLLLDTYEKNSYGGTGQTFSWNMIPPRIKHPYFLAGGLNQTNIDAVLKIPCFAYDISGGVETDGTKDRKKIYEIIQQIRKENKLCQKENSENMADNLFRKH